MADGTPKLADFGFDPMKTTGGGSELSMGMATCRNTGYTPVYAAPELMSHLLGDELSSESDDDVATVKTAIRPTRACDMYSVGVVIWEVVTGQVPWSVEIQKWSRHKKSHSAITYKLLLAVQNNKRPKIPTGCSSLLQSIIERCWHQDPIQRPTAQDVVAELQKT
jgi:serine/threonine protein kinase